MTTSRDAFADLLSTASFKTGSGGVPYLTRRESPQHMDYIVDGMLLHGAAHPVRENTTLLRQNGWDYRLSWNGTFPILTREPAAGMDAHGYDGLAEAYDGLYEADRFKAENSEVFRHIHGRPCSVLDVGAGTGLTLDYIAPARYLGIDPSAGMLRKLAQRIRGVSGYETICTPFEDFHTAERFDVVLCLFGVTGYMSAEQVRRLPDYVAPGGTYVVTVYDRDYVPVPHAGSAPSLGGTEGLHYHPTDILPGRVHATGNGNHVIVGSVP